MQDFVYFLGRFHVLVLHLPIALILVAVLLDWVARRERFRRLEAAAPFLWGGAALSAVLTAVLGYMHFAEGSFAGPTGGAHRFFGTTLAVLTVVLWWLCSRRHELYRTINIVTGLVALLLVSITGHFGGNLTHGESFLWQYAPGPLKSLGSGALRKPGAASNAPRVAVSPQASAAVPSGEGADAELLDQLYRAGFLVRQVSPTDPRLVVSVYSPGALVIAPQLALLATAADQIVELNLQDAGLDDNELANIGKFTELTRLRLSRNQLTDATVARFASMTHLERLNLYANAGVTDASVDTLAAIPSLRRLDVWQTGITEAGIARLRQLRPELELQAATTIVYPIDPLPNGAR
ncbi:MAG TPA: DUF2231 domain-containing protein [Gammaproteobacteria bacterium]|nr:DUF2231 domain-containing protein [Gammaproteobacteria bacterium]